MNELDQVVSAIPAVGEVCQPPVPRSTDKAATVALSKVFDGFRSSGWPSDSEYSAIFKAEVEAATVPLLRAGADANDPSMQDAWGDQHWPIHEAAIADSCVLLAALIEAGAAIDAKDSWRCTALIYAVFKGNAQCVRLLLDAGADPLWESDGWDDWLGRTSIHEAATVGNPEILAMILEVAERKPNFGGWYGGFNSPWRAGTTCLMAAAKAGSIKCCEILLERGANIHAEGDSDYEGQTAFDVATDEVAVFLAGWAEREELQSEASLAGVVDGTGEAKRQSRNRRI